MEEGHMLQAETLGKQMVNLANLLKITARQIGGEVEVFAKDVRFTGNKIAVDFLTLEAPPKKSKKRAKSNNDSGLGPVTTNVRSSGA
jgi:hypothetical protein